LFVTPQTFVITNISDRKPNKALLFASSSINISKVKKIGTHAAALGSLLKDVTPKGNFALVAIELDRPHDFSAPLRMHKRVHLDGRVAGALSRVTPVVS
jgi:hypothetical protein